MIATRIRAGHSVEIEIAECEDGARWVVRTSAGGVYSPEWARPSADASSALREAFATIRRHGAGARSRVAVLVNGMRSCSGTVGNLAHAVEYGGAV